MVGLFFKDIILGIIFLSAIPFLFNLGQKKVKDIYPILNLSLFIIISVIASILSNNLPAHVILATIRNYIFYPFCFIPSYQFGLSHGSWYVRTYLKKVIYIVLWLTIIIAMAQIFDFFEFPYQSIVNKGTFKFISGGFISYIELGNFISLCPILLSLLNKNLSVNKNSNLYKFTISRSYLFEIATIFVSILIVGLSGSRLGLVCGLVNSIYYYHSSKESSIYNYGFKYLFLIALLGFLSYYFYTTLQTSRFVYLVQDSRFNSFYSLLIEQFDSPFFGKGLGTFGASSTVVIGSREDSVIDFGQGQYIEGQYIEGQYVDSSFISIILQIGFLGFTVYLTLIIKIINRVFIGLKLISDNGRFKFAFQLFLANVFIYSCAFPYIDGWNGAMYFFGTLGFITGVIRKTQIELLENKG